MPHGHVWPYSIYIRNYDRWSGIDRHSILMIARRIAHRINKRRGC